jgi:DNA gyrase subunit A
MALIAELRAILGDEDRVLAVIKEELLVVKQRYGNERRTQIIAGEGEIDLESLIREEDMVISISHTGYVKRLALSAYRQQKRGGVGVMAAQANDDDWIEHLLVASTHDYVLFFTNVGKVYRLKVHELPEAQRQARGRALVNLLPMREGEKVCTIIATRDFSEGEYLVQATRNGVVKKTRFREYDTPLRADGIIAINIREGDELVAARLTSGADDILLVSRQGQAVRFAESEARAMGRATSGVAGMRLRKGDELIAIEVARDESDLLVVTDNGYGKRTRVEEYPRKGRGTMGVLTIRLVESRGKLAGAMVVRDSQQVMLISVNGTATRTSVNGISRMGRNTQGVTVMRLRDGDRLSSVALVAEQPDELDGENGEDAEGSVSDTPGLGAGAPEPTLPAADVDLDIEDEPEDDLSE